jgi:hypoxanthine phosphoribosyltransferase
MRTARWESRRPSRSLEPPVKLLLDEAELRAGVERLAAEISRDYVRRPLTIIGVLTGSMVLVADLIRRIDLPMRVGLVQARSYQGATTVPGPLVLNFTLLPELRGRHVLLVDDIFDTGHTLSAIVDQLETSGALTVRTLVLLRKADRQEVSLRPDYVGFDIPNEFVVGYGLDYQDAYRHLPYVAKLEADEIASGPPN